MLSAVLIGAGGYGRFYIKRVLECPDLDIRVAGVVDPAPERCDRLDELRALGAVHYHSLDDFYRGNSADIAVISSPIQLHSPHMLTALAHGSHVLCEKPLCPLIQQVPDLVRARDSAKKIVSIGYQWSFSRAIQALKADIMDGWYGKPVQLKTIVLWPRGNRYYTRNDWAGAIQDPRGAFVLDSPVNNAAAHFLHNMLYVLGDAPDTSASPVEVEGEAYQANDIENYDTAFLRCRTAEGVPVMLFTSHATRSRRDPRFEFIFENGVVSLDEGSGALSGRRNDGAERAYGVPEADVDRKLSQTLEAVRHGERSLCGIEAGTAHTRCVNGFQESLPEIVTFPAGIVREETGEDTRRWVEGLDDIFEECYGRFALPSECGVSWARKGGLLNLADYNHFPRESGAGE